MVYSRADLITAHVAAKLLIGKRYNVKGMIDNDFNGYVEKDVTKRVSIIHGLNSINDKIIFFNGNKMTIPVDYTILGNGSYGIYTEELTVPQSFLNKSNENELLTEKGYRFCFYNYGIKQQPNMNCCVSNILISEMRYGASSSFCCLVLPLGNNKVDFSLYCGKGLTLHSGERIDLCALSLFSCSIDENEFDVYKTDDFVIIEAKEKISEERFKRKTNYILEAIGFFSGLYINDESFCFFSEDNEFLNITGFKYTKLSGSIRIDSKLITSEVFLNEVIFPNKKYRSDKSSFISNDVFDEMLKRLNEEENHKFESIMFLLFYSSNYSLDTRSICLSAALESIRGYSEAKNKSMDPSQVEDNTKSEDCKKFKQALKGVFPNDIINGYVDKCFRKHKSNRDKLIAPFKFYNIRLDERDLEAIRARDKFLHGGSPSFGENGISLPIEQEGKKLLALSERQFSLCYILILKIIGYQGYIMNYKKVADYFETMKTDSTDCMIYI